MTDTGKRGKQTSIGEKKMKESKTNKHRGDRDRKERKTNKHRGDNT